MLCFHFSSMRFYDYFYLYVGKVKGSASGFFFVRLIHLNTFFYMFGLVFYYKSWGIKSHKHSDLYSTTKACVIQYLRQDFI